MAIFELARELDCFASTIESGMSSAEFTEWQAYFQIRNEDAVVAKAQAAVNNGAQTRARKALRTR